MNRNIDTMLDYEASRKPVVAQLLANLLTTSDADINATPSILKWIRQALIKRKTKLLAEAAFNGLTIIDGWTPDPPGEVRRWMAPDMFVNIDRGGAVQVVHNRLIWLPQNGGVWYETMFSKLIDHRVFSLSVTVGQMKKTQYVEAFKKDAALNCPDGTPGIIAQNGGENNLLVRYGVRFSR
jgi:hypothetical protein